MVSKLVSLEEAIAKHIRDGESVALGLALEHAIPFAAVHEIIRQGKRDLTLIGPISDIAFDQLVGAGCVSRIMAAWVGNVSYGIGYNFSRAVEAKQVKMIDYSNLSIAQALLAAALGIPCIPTKTLIGSDILNNLTAEGLAKLVECPFTGERLVMLRAVKPDVAIVHTQRCDELGYAQMWGSYGIVREACQAANRVIVTAEEIVTHEEITRDPNSIICPPHKVVAVAKVEYGAHPSPLAGYYNRDHSCFKEYYDTSKTPEGFRGWLSKWVLSPRSREDYLRLVKLDEIKVKQTLEASVRTYGY